jgi:hypothetical protein
MRSNEYQPLNLFTPWRSPRVIRAANIDVALTLARRMCRSHRTGLAVVNYRDAAPSAITAVPCAIRASVAA